MNKSIAAVVAAAITILIEDDVGVSDVLEDIFPLIANQVDGRGGVKGRRWVMKRNDRDWFFRYAICNDFSSSQSWKGLFRVRKDVFDLVLQELRPFLTKQVTRFRLPIEPERSLAAFFMYLGTCTGTHVASQLGLGVSTVLVAVKEVSRLICDHFTDAIKFPTTGVDVATVMDGFKDIAGLPYCAGAIDGSHIEWHRCPTEQYFEYRCYKGYPSFVLFAVCSADRRVTYAQIGKPGVLGDATLLEQSTLLTNIQSNKWLGTDIPSLRIGDVDVRPYLLGDCAFRLTPYMMRSCTKPEKSANPELEKFDAAATSTRKPVECVFGMLKSRFPILKQGFYLSHEDDCCFTMTACVIIHNLCIAEGDLSDEETTLDVDHDLCDIDESVTSNTHVGKKQRDALLAYLWWEEGHY